MSPRPDPSHSGAPPSAAVRTFPAAHPQPARALSACELELAADVQMAVGNRRRAELLSWQAHDARTGMPS